MLELLRAQFGVSLLLLEGGPTLFGRFVADGCVDELFLTIAPQVAGRNMPPLRPGFIARVEFLPETAPWLNIVSVKERGNHLYLRYRAA
jgi:riboflavin biosynthesis pyrimidine reductase